MAGAILISFSAVFVKLVAVEPTVSAFYRMFFGGLVLSVLVAVKGEKVWFGWRAAGVILIAALCFAGDLFFWHRSILSVGPGLGTLLANFQVFLLALAGLLLFHESMRWQVAVSIPLAMAGLGLLVGAEWSSLPADYRAGVGFGLLTAFCYAAYILSLRISRLSEAAPSPMAIIAPQSMVCALILASFVGLEGGNLEIPSWRDGGVLLAYGIIAQVLGWVLISHGMANVRASQVGLILLLQPTFSFVWDVLFFGRRFTIIEGFGALLALAAIYLGSQQRRQS